MYMLYRARRRRQSPGFWRWRRRGTGWQCCAAKIEPFSGVVPRKRNIILSRRLSCYRRERGQCWPLDDQTLEARAQYLQGY